MPPDQPPDATEPATQARLTALEHRVAHLERQLARAPYLAGAALAEPAAAHPSRKGGTLGTLIAVLVILVFVGGMGVLFWTLLRTRLEGRLTLHRGETLAWTLTPDLCASGDAFIPPFMGAVLRQSGRDGYSVRLTLPDTVVIETPDGAFIIPPGACRTRELRVEWTRTEVNDVSGVDGALRLDCALDDGARIEADVVFDGCHRSWGW
ncbi:MAG: hypothetical protein H6701_12005 [Myxococcales bacterium]|nr:hypothetical protein [Myxococcales bacterium]